MKNPKWQCAYPEQKRLVFGGKFLTQWNGYYLDLIQTNGGTISADRDWGYYGDVANLSYTANSGYYFNGWQTTGTTATGNQIKFTNNDVSAKASFINPNPSKLYNNTTEFTVVGKNSFSGGFYSQKLFLDGPYYDSRNPKFLSTNSATIKNKNYFVLKCDMLRTVGEGQYYWYTTGVNAGVVLRGTQLPASSFQHSFVPELEGSIGTGGSLERDCDYSFGKRIEWLYSRALTGTSATSITSNSIPTGTQPWSAIAVPELPYAKHFNHGRIGSYTDTFSGYWIGKYTLNVNASGKWNYSGYCYEPSAYKDNKWRTLKYVFDMNTFAYSSYIGDECVYKQTNNLTWSATSDSMTNGKSKLFAIHNFNPFINAYWSTQWNATSAANRNVGNINIRNVSFTYFNTCEQANVWAKNN